MVFICTSLCLLDVENLLWSFLTASQIYGRRKEPHRNTPNPDEMLKKPQDLQFNNLPVGFQTPQYTQRYLVLSRNEQLLWTLHLVRFSSGRYTIKAIGKFSTPCTKGHSSAAEYRWPSKCLSQWHFHVFYLVKLTQLIIIFKRTVTFSFLSSFNSSYIYF